ncbi:transmembrane protein 186 [Denticeps clupeoides]|uniref:transmembrane protein 186 n=1 Tax=Denticeps clupeoides TaxID=299321 RepID=UPI0010A3CEAF|nr:transmembrane protein 186 [Denticeps clupeoides]
MLARLARWPRSPVLWCRNYGTADDSATSQATRRQAPAFSAIYAFPAIRLLRGLSRLKLLQTGLTGVLLPPVYYLHLAGQAPPSLAAYSTGVALLAAATLYPVSHCVRRVVGMMYLDRDGTTLRVSHLTFWGRRKDVYVPVSDVMTLGDAGDAPGELILRLRRYSRPGAMYFSPRLGRVLDPEAFRRVFGSPS